MSGPGEQGGPDERRPRVGFLGAGRMGLPMCANLVAAGYEVTAADVRPEREGPVRAIGAGWGATNVAVAAGADVLLTSLPGPGEVREALLGTDGALAALRPGSTWIDLSSSTPAVGREVAERAAARGVDVLECPVGGDPTGAAAGTLRLVVGGDAAVLARHRRLLDVLGDPDRLIHVGGLGAGYTTKLLVNLLWFGQAVATAEALLIGRRAGLDLDVLRRALAGSAASTAFIERDLDALFAGDYLTSFGLDRCAEELDGIIGIAAELGLEAELSALVARIHRRALDRYGPIDGEQIAVRLLEEESGVDLRSGAPDAGSA
jgi:3-hydroxyisobutyrate dehydrogenase